MSSAFAEFRNSLPAASRKALPLRPRLLEETAESMLRRTASYWLVIVPDEGAPELGEYASPDDLSDRLRLLAGRGFAGTVYVFEGTRVLLSDPPQLHLVFGDGRLLPVAATSELLRVDPDGRFDPDGWDARMARYQVSQDKLRQRRDADPPGYTEGEYAAPGPAAFDADDPYGELETGPADADVDADADEFAEPTDDLP
jgi:hypothetical protein